VLDLVHPAGPGRRLGGKGKTCHHPGLDLMRPYFTANSFGAGGHTFDLRASMEYAITATFLLAVVAGSFAAVILGGYGVAQLIASAL
jgi:hypothetical protein